jgi:hypothetical protein
MPRFIPFLVLAIVIVGVPVRTAGRADSWRWETAFVDATREHLELRFGSNQDDWNDWLPVARVGRPVNRVFPVQFLLPDDDCEHAEAREAVIWSLDFYLIELGKPDPWEYATYHTTTQANLYARVHWGWVRPDLESRRPENVTSGYAAAFTRPIATTAHAQSGPGRVSQSSEDRPRVTPRWSGAGRPLVFDSNTSVPFHVNAVQLRSAWPLDSR